MNLEFQSAGRSVSPLIDGVTRPSESDGTVEVVNPSTGEALMSFATGGEADVDAAVASARRAFDDGRWSEAAPSFRKRTLHRLADLVEAQAKTLDALDAEEMGKPISVAYANAASAASLIRFYAEAVDKVLGDVYASDKNSLVFQRRVPRGVVAAIVPWNFPTSNAILKLAPALAAGNSVVLKPSELSSRSAIHLAYLTLEAGLPPGVLNVVPGLGLTVGRALGLHSEVDLLTFTGSTAVGQQLLQYAGQSNMKIVMAECGGKSPQIVFDDGVDLEAAATWIAGLLLTNQGQICSVGSRVLVQRSIESALIEKIAAHLKSAKMGHALDAQTTFGPMASQKQCDRVMAYIEGARSQGAQLFLGGGRALAVSGGFFVEPTVFRDVSPESRIAQEEIFGPVLSVVPFDTEAEAVRIANGTVYGLAAYVWTANLSTGLRMAKQIRSTVLINAAAPAGEGAGHAFSTEPMRLSGFGVEGGLAGLETYLRRQLVWFNHG